jgi:hypothetical protein
MDFDVHILVGPWIQIRCSIRVDLHIDIRIRVVIGSSVEVYVAAQKCQRYQTQDCGKPPHGWSPVEG